MADNIYDDAAPDASDDDDASWSERIDQAIKDRKPWWERSRKIKAIYRDKRDGVIPSNENKTFNILWSNVQTMAPVLYSHLPIPVIMAKESQKDPASPIVAQALKKTIVNELYEYDFDGALRQTILEFLLTGQGQGWVAYEPQFEEIEQGDIDEGGEVPTGEIKISENCYYVFVNNDDFITNKARVWEEVTFVGRKLMLTRMECKKYFPEKYIKLNYGEYNKLCVWEIWDKTSKEQLFIAPDQIQKILKRGPVPIEFDQFFPCPKPLLSNLDNETIVPVPDYALYQDQANDLSKYTNRLSRIGDALKVRGVYQAVDTNVQRLFDDDQENVLVPTSTPMEKYEPFKFVPLEIFAQCAIQVSSLKSMAKQDIYELTGLSDIIRGASDPRETLGAQEIKNQWGSLRIKEKQKDVQRFIRDILRLKCEIIAEHYDISTIQNISAVEIPPEAESLLRDGAVRNFRIEIETDSTIEPDQQQEKEDRTEFLGALSGYLETAINIGAQAPELAPMLGDLVMFGIKAFPVGAEMEEEIQKSLDMMTQQAVQTAGQPKPDPEVQKEEMKSDTELKIQQMKNDNDQKLATINGQRDLELEKLRLRGQKVVAKLGAGKAQNPITTEVETDEDFEEGPTKLDEFMAMQQQQLQVMMQMVQTLGQGLQELGKLQVQGDQAVIQALTRPKQVIRNENDQIVGVQ